MSVAYHASKLDDDIKIIIRHCQLLSRINLTSCRGIDVRHRRNIFETR